MSRHQVVAGILVDDGAVLLALRSADRRWFPGVWDLPGGHVEPGEAPRDALVRELAEELGVTAEVPAEPAAHVTGDDYDVAVYRVDRWAGTPRNVASDEHDEVRFVTPDDARGLLLADSHLLPVVERVLAGGAGGGVRALVE